MNGGTDPTSLLRNIYARYIAAEDTRKWRASFRISALMIPLAAALGFAGSAYGQTLGWGAHASNIAGGIPGAGIAIGYLANGDSTSPIGSSPIAIGAAANASGAGSQVAIGDHAAATGKNAIAIGGNAFTTKTSATGDYSVSIGTSSVASGYGAYALGGDAAHGATASGKYAMAFGAKAVAAMDNTLALGSDAQALNANDVALGSNSVTAAAIATQSVDINGKTYAFAGTAPTSTVSVGGAGAERTVTNVAAGQITTTSTDAVNGSQLNATNLALTAEDVKVNTLGGNVANAFGGGATFDPATGAMTSPNYTVYGQSYTGVDNTIAALQNNAPLQYSTSSAPTTGLGANGAPVSNDVTLVGPNAGAPVALHNVAPGVIAAGSTDAVNGGQLYAEAQRLNTLGGNVANAFGGGATFDPATGAMTSPNYTVYGQSYTGVENTVAALQNNAPLQYSTSAAPTTGLGANGLPVSNDVTLVGPNAGAPVALHNVAPGVIAAASTDAVNGGQLYAEAARLNTLGGNVANAFGGGAVFNPTTGAMTSPTYTVYGQSFTGVESTVAALQNNAPVQYSTSAAPTTGLGANGAPVSNDVTLVGPDATAPVTLHNVQAGVAATDAVNVSQLNAAIGDAVVNIGGGSDTWVTSNPAQYIAPSASGTDAVAVGSGSVASGNASTAIGTGAQASAANSVAVGANSVADQPNTVSVGSTGNERRVTNVAPGVAGTDAVNVNQLNARSNELQTQIGDNLKKSYAGSAAAIAIAGLRYDDRPGKISAAAAAGYYHNQMGLAMGVGSTSDNGSWRFNGGITVTPTLSSPDVGAMVGVSHTFN